MKKLVLPLILITLFGAGCFVSSRNSADRYLQQYLKDSLSTVTQHVKDRIAKIRYMEGEVLAVKTDLPGWENIPVTLYKYRVTDKSTGTLKYAQVYLCNPGFERLARWVVSACWYSKHSINRADIDKLINHIRGQSGAQFPVMGIVYEDMAGNGVNYPYVFKDGVTVYPAKFKLTTNPLTAVQIDSCITLRDSLLKLYTGTYARIASTTREDYLKAGGSDSVGHSSAQAQKKIAWLATVRRLYIKALKSDNNELITAWARSNL